MSVGLRLLADGEGDAFVSTGNTGALFTGATLLVRKIKGIQRAAIASVLPFNNPVLLLDSGANLTVTPEQLDQFAMMGSIYMEKVMGVKNPKVGLANIGAEEEKGNELAKQTYQLMKKQNLFNFAGNVEARDIPTGDYDVVVADGFVGNVFLKFMEGLASTMISMIKEYMMSNLRSKIGALLVKPAMKQFKKKLDYEEAGGAPLLGVEGAVVKAHGSSNGKAMFNAVRQARLMCETDVVGVIREGVAKMAAQQETTAE